MSKIPCIIRKRLKCTVRNEQSWDNKLVFTYTEQKKKGIILVMWPFSVLVESGYMGYEILLTAIFHIGLCHKFRDQSSMKGLSRQWVEFQKVCAGRIITKKISICVDRRYLYFFPDRKSTKSWTNSYALERNSVQKMVGFVMTGVLNKKTSHKNCFTSRKRVL